MDYSISFDDGQLIIEEFSSQPAKRQKGKSLLIIPESYTVIDLETTGLNPRYDYIIEVACIKYRVGKEIDRFHSFIQPPRDYLGNFVNSFITDMTGITNEILENAPIFSSIANELWDFIDGELIVGHNVNFDINFLYDNFEKDRNTLFQNNFVDTLRLSRRVLPELGHHRLCDLDEYFHINNEHHHALDDCITANIILGHLAEIIRGKLQVQIEH